MNNNQSEKINLKMPVPGEIFSNEKGQKYQIVTVAKHVVTKETLVIYQALYGDFDMRALPLERFITRKTEAKVIENTTNINERVIPAVVMLVLQLIKTIPVIKESLSERTKMKHYIIILKM